MWFDWLIMTICCKNKKSSWISKEFPDYFLILEELEKLERLERLERLEGMEGMENGG